MCVHVFTHISTYMLKSDLRFKCEMLYIQTLFDLQGMLPPVVKLVISLLN